LPVHRVDPNSSRSKVFAYKPEIDLWLREKANTTSNRLKERKRFRGLKWVSIGLIPVSCLLIISFYRLFIYQKGRSPDSEKAVSVAIMPFESHSSSALDRNFSEGVAVEIANRLAMFGKIRVLPPSLHFGNKNAVEKGSNADFILKGNVNKESSQFWLSVELVDPRHRVRLWGMERSDSLENILIVENAICRSLIQILSSVNRQNPSSSKEGEIEWQEALNENPVADQPSKTSSGESTDGWKLYYQGRYYLEMYTEEANQLAINLFNQAIERDAAFALAYIGLAECYCNFVNFNWNSDPAWIEKAESLLQTGQEISPNLPEYYYTLGMLLLLKDIYLNRGTGENALETARDGLIKYPNHAGLNSLLGYCHYLRFGEAGDPSDFERALDYKEKSFWLKPFSLNNIVFVELLLLDKEFSKAIEVCTIIQKADQTQFARFKLGVVFYYLGDLERSRSIFQQLENTNLDLRVDSLLYQGMIASQEQEKEKALQILERIQKISPSGYIKDDGLKMASIYAGIGIKEISAGYLNEFFSSRYGEKYRHIYLKYMKIDKNFSDQDMDNLK
jgi:TolB-like protein